MTLNVLEAEGRAQRAVARWGAAARPIEADLLALAELARELASELERLDKHGLGDRGLLAKARAAGLLPARESAPVEPKEEA